MVYFYSYKVRHNGVIIHVGENLKEESKGIKNAEQFNFLKQEIKEQVFAQALANYNDNVRSTGEFDLETLDLVSRGTSYETSVTYFYHYEIIDMNTREILKSDGDVILLNSAIKSYNDYYYNIIETAKQRELQKFNQGNLLFHITSLSMLSRDVSRKKKEI